MGNYSAIRGWLEMSEGLASQARGIIQSYKSRASEYRIEQEATDLYLQGFVYREKPINWSTYIFYGADIRTYHVKFVEDLIREVAQNVIQKDGESTNYVQGLFHVNDEDRGEMIVWIIDHGKLRKATADYPFTD